MLTIVFLCKVFLFFLIDLSVLTLFHSSYVLSLGFFYALCTTRASFWQLCVAGFFALLQPFILTGSMGTELVIMVPLAIGVWQLSEIADLAFLVRAFQVFMCLVIHGAFGYWWVGSMLPFWSIIISLLMVYLV